MKSLLILISFLFFCCTTYSSQITPLSRSNEYYTDRQLIGLALEYGVIPMDVDEAYFKEAAKLKNSIINWIGSSRSFKVEMVDYLKKSFLTKSEVVIKNPSEYYVDEINGVIYNSIKNDGKSTARDGVGIIFRTIALMEGDYDDGGSKVEALKEYLGDGAFERYKINHPEKYQYLVEMDSRQLKP